ncbi:MAG: GvpL/GvpF family gas vesicle protein [Solirubrobacterales bacterium]
MAAGDLDAAIEALAAEAAPRLVAEVREDAVAAVRDDLSRRLTDQLLRKCGEELLRDSHAPAPAPHPLAEHARSTATAHYVYGVVPAGVTLPPDLIGVEPTAPVERVEEGGLAALVSQVPLAEFDEDALRANLNDVAWLEEKARAHEAVLEAALARTGVVPLRLCTVFADEVQVRAMLVREQRVLDDALERLQGRAEWGVKAYADRGAVEREALRQSADDEEEADELSAGTAYMKRRRAEARAREEVEEIADAWARAIHARLAGITTEALLNPLQRPELSGHEGEMFLNGVYLVSDAEAPAFRAAVGGLVEEFDRRGVEIDLTGPWPAYNFVKSSIEAAR